MNNEMVRFRVYRNKVQRLSRQLRRKFYARKISSLRESDPRNWWRSVKQLTGQQSSRTSQPLTSLANQLHNGDMSALASSVNSFFQHGGLKRRSTTHALVDMLHHWHSAADMSQSARVVFIDFAKAF